MLLMSSCACIMSQGIPPQNLYVGADCGAAAPDYRMLLTFSDNCGIDTIEQMPTPGSWLTERYNTILVRAWDRFENHTDVLISVELVDTIPPSLVDVDSSLIVKVYQTINNLYDTADRLLAYNEMYFDDAFPWDDIQFQWVDSAGVTQTFYGIPDSLRPTNLYCNYTMVTFTPECYVFNKEGRSRWVTFMQPGDTLILQ